MVGLANNKHVIEMGEAREDGVEPAGCVSRHFPERLNFVVPALNEGEKFLVWICSELLSGVDFGNSSERNWACIVQSFGNLE